MLNPNVNNKNMTNFIKALFGDFPLGSLGIRNVFVRPRERKIIIEWLDGNETMSQAVKDDDFDILTGFSIAYTKHSFKTKSQYKKKVLEAINTTSFDMFELNKDGRIVLKK